MKKEIDKIMQLQLEIANITKKKKKEEVAILLDELINAVSKYSADITARAFSTRIEKMKEDIKAKTK
jgi:hypothetical protein